MKPERHREGHLRTARTPLRGVATWVAALALAAPATGDTYPRVEGVDVHEYVFRLTVTDESDRIDAMATIDVRFDRAGVTEIPLDLVGTSDDGSRGMAVVVVWVASGTAASAAIASRPTVAEFGAPATFEHANDRLVVALPSPSVAGGRAAVTIGYSGVPANGLEIGETKHGDRSFFSENWPNRARHWLPTIDHPYDKARSQMIVTAPSHYQVISNGRLVEETDLHNGTRRTHWRHSVPIPTWLNVLGVARFAVQHLDDFEGIPVQTWVYPQDREAGFHDFAVPTHDVLAYFSDQIGPFGYEKLANVQSNSVSGGMESSTAIFYDDDSVTGNRDVGWRNVVIHELAHHWFGNSVTEWDWDDVWLSEGFATYFTLLYREHAYGRDDFVDGLRRARERVFRFYERNPDYRVVHEDLDDMSKVTTGMQYQKGAWTLHMLRGLVGTETYWAGIREYYARYRDGNASTADFRRVMEEVSGVELEWFFDQWLRQGGVPKLAGTWSHADGEVALELRQGQQTYEFRLPLEVELEFADGSRRREAILMDAPNGRFTLPADRAPSAVVIDPDTWMLVEVELTRKES